MHTMPSSGVCVVFVVLWVLCCVVLCCVVCVCLVYAHVRVCMHARVYYYTHNSSSIPIITNGRRVIAVGVIDIMVWSRVRPHPSTPANQ